MFQRHAVTAHRMFIFQAAIALGLTLPQPVMAVVIPVLDAGGVADGSGATLADLSTGGDTIGAITGVFSATANASFAAPGPAAQRWNGSEFDYSPTSTDTATWTFGGLSTGEMWDVFVSFHSSATPQGNLSLEAPYTVQGGSPILVNQRNGAAANLVLTDAAANPINFQQLGTATVDSNGEIAVTLSGTGLGGNNWVVADAVALVPFEAPALALELFIDRETGNLTLSNNTGGAVDLLGYTLTSPAGALASAGWKSVAENYDADGPNTADGGALIGTVDSDDNWTFLSDPADRTDLSEFELEGGDGGTLAQGQSVNLGTAWLQSPTEDITFVYALAANGEIEEGIVEFTGNGDAPFLFGDLDFNGTAFELADFTNELLPNLVSAPDNVSAVEAYQMGDLDGDLDIDKDDFRIFKNNFLAAGGSAAALSAAVASVPEPATVTLLLGVVAVGLITLRSDRMNRPLFPLTRHLAMAFATFALIGTMSRNATALVIPLIDAGGVADGSEATFEDLSTGGETVGSITGGFSITGPADFVRPNGDPLGVARWNGSEFDYSPDSTETATWTFSGLNPGDTWDVYVSWGPAQTNLTQVAPYTIQGGADIFVDQRAGAPGDLVLTDTNAPTPVNFLNLGEATVDGNGEVAVTLRGTGLGGGLGGIEWVIADAVALVEQFEPLVLEVNKTTGFASLINENTAEDFDVDTYQISSDTGGVGSLDPTWAGLPGWTGGGASDEFLISDFNLTGSTVIASEDSASIGRVFETSVGNEDLQFQYTTVNNQTIQGVVRYVAIAAVPGDYNNNGVVDAADYTVWRDNLGGAGLPNEGGISPGVVDAADYAFWKSRFGATSGAGSLTAARVPEPATSLLAAVGLAAMAAYRRRIGLFFPVIVIGGVAWVVMGSTTQAAFTLDREYRFGDPGSADATLAPPDVDAAASVGEGNPIGYVISGTTFTGDETGPSGAFIDLEVFGPTYTSTTARPGAGANEFGARFDGANDYLLGSRLGLPSTSVSSLGYIDPITQQPNPGPLNYNGIANRGFQFWARPDAAGNGSAQSLVADTLQHGVRISEEGTWVMQYAGTEFDSDVEVTFNDWSHVMVVRPFGTTGPASGSRLYVDGVVVAAAAGGYTGADDAPLVVGANSGTVDTTPAGTMDFYRGLIDDLELFVLGDNSANAGPPPGQNYGTFNPATDNAFIADALAGFDPADVNLDTSVNQVDVAEFVENWKFVNLVLDVPAGGDLNSRTKGDLNLDGLIDIRDAVILHQGLVANGQGGLDFSLLNGNRVPEPTTLGLLALAATAVYFRSRVARRLPHRHSC